MRKVNVQRDLDSQKRMAESFYTPVINPEPQPETYHAESEIIPEPTVDEVPVPEKAKKGGRQTKGNV